MISTRLIVSLHFPSARGGLVDERQQGLTRLCRSGHRVSRRERERTHLEIARNETKQRGEELNARLPDWTERWEGVREQVKLSAQEHEYRTDERDRPHRRVASQHVTSLPA